MSKVTDSDTESNSFDIESLLSCNNPCKLVPYSFEPFASSINEDSDSERNLQQQSDTTIGILDNVNAIIVERWKLMQRVFAVQKQMKSTKRCSKVN